MIHRLKFLFTLLLLPACCLFLMPQGVLGQTGDEFSANAVAPAPCWINPNLPECLPLARSFQKAVAVGPITDINSAGNFLYRYTPPDPGSSVPTPVDMLDPASNIALLKKGNTRWVRLWADWTKLQPDPADIDPNSDMVKLLDAQIRAARKEGFGVMLTAWRFPFWANFPLLPNDFPRDEFEASLYVPSQLDADSPWGRWINFLVTRYGYSEETRDSLRYVDFLEIVNEPNSQMKPQRDFDGSLLMPERTAEMFKTAQDIVKQQNVEVAAVLGPPHPTTLVLAGPAATDTTPDTPFITGYQKFTRALLLELQKKGFDNRDPYFVWTQHSYGDVERVRDCAPGDVQCFRLYGCRANDKVCAKRYVNAAAWTRKTLVDGVSNYLWRGWPGGDNPSLMLTEGGARLHVVRKRYHTKSLSMIKDIQAELVEGHFRRMFNPSPLSEGIAMVTNYLTYTDPCFDSGMLNIIGNSRDWEAAQRRCGRHDPYTGGGGNKRPVYDKWTLLPATR